MNWVFSTFCCICKGYCIIYIFLILSIEPSTKETLLFTEGTEVPAPSKRCKLPSSDGEIPPGVSAQRPSSKGVLFLYMLAFGVQTENSRP